MGRYKALWFLDELPNVRRPLAMHAGAADSRLLGWHKVSSKNAAECFDSGLS